MKRTHTCGELTTEQLGQEVTLAGWVQSIRDHGGGLFIDLRDRYGITQIHVHEGSPELLAEAGRFRKEWVIQTVGTVESRPEGMANLKINTGGIEISVKAFTVFSESKVPPFETDEYAKVNEDIRLAHRYLDLRRPQMQRNLRVRHDILAAIRTTMGAEGFTEIETPILAKSTPEGARDYLVPSRVHHGHYYALPQSPQIFKQILMISGCDKYYQIARCFRDEDLRADRQPEFTQLDIEMSFAEPDDVFAIVEKCMTAACKAGIDLTIETPFPRLSYADAIKIYGTDKPDTRFEMFQHDVGALVADCDFKVFTGVVESGGLVKGMAIPGGSAFSRKNMDTLIDIVKIYGGKGMAWMKVGEGEYTGAPVKFFTTPQLDALRDALGAGVGDAIVFVADKPSVAHAALAAVRNEVGARLGLAKPDKFSFTWVTDFPLVEWNEDAKRWDSSHHPFTSVHEDDLETVMTAGTDADSPLGAVRSSAYDLVLNGVELASGSVRIHDAALQSRIFELLGISPEQASERFGFFIEALQYGTPPHAGIAPGIDRLVAMLLGFDNIREVIAFPKTAKAIDPMTGAPGTVDAIQLKELGIREV